MRSSGLVLLDKPYAGDVTPTKLTDRSRFGNDGAWTAVTAKRLPSGLWVATFDGADSVIEVPHDQSQLLTQGGTLAAWINPISVGEGTVARLIFKAAGGAGENGFQWRIHPSGSQMRFRINGGTEVGSAAVTFGVLQFVCVTFTAAGAVINYNNGAVSGTPDSTNAASGIIDTSSLFIGNDVNINVTWDGDLALPRIYNRALSAGEILQLFNEQRHWFGV